MGCPTGVVGVDFVALDCWNKWTCSGVNLPCFCKYSVFFIISWVCLEERAEEVSDKSCTGDVGVSMIDDEWDKGNSVILMAGDQKICSVMVNKGEVLEEGEGDTLGGMISGITTSSNSWSTSWSKTGIVTNSKHGTSKSAVKGSWDIL